MLRQLLSAAVACVAQPALAFLSLAISSAANAGYVVVLGDGTPTFTLSVPAYEPPEDNRTFFRTLLGPSAAPQAVMAYSGNGKHLDTFYKTLQGVTSTLLGEGM